MKKSLMLLALCALTSTMNAQERGPELGTPGIINPPANAIPLSQADFATGTLSITTPGYYYLTENIEFNPPNNPAPIPPFHLGWFSVLAIETDNVTIDLNAHTIQIAEEFLDRQHFGAIITLNNQPFPQGVGGFINELVTPKNIVIMNGTIGRSRHHGIHGHHNSNVRLQNLVVRDWETSAISLNAPRSLEIRSVTVSGNEHDLPINGLGALLRDLHKALSLLGDPQALSFKNKIKALMDDGVGGSPGVLPDTNMWGILLNEEFSVGEFSTDDSNGTTDNILIEDVTISNIKANIKQTIGMADSNGTLLKDTPGFTLRWVDAFDDEGNFAPNDILKAQVYLTNKLTPNALPAGFAQNILSASPNGITFRQQVRPLFGLDNRGHVSKGVVGLRLEVGRGVKVRNCQIVDIENQADAVESLADIPFGQFYSSQEEERTIITDAYGVSMSACTGCEFENVTVLNCKSSNGYVDGIRVRNNSTSNVFTNCESKNHSAEGTTLDGSNQPSRVHGFQTDNGSHANVFRNCRSESCTAPFVAVGFKFADSNANQLINCCVSNNKTTAAVSSSFAKKAYGFASCGCNSTMFENCTAIGINCDADGQEADATAQTDSIAAGFILRSSDQSANKDAIIHNCTSSGNHGGSGKAVGIYIKSSSNDSVKGNTVERNQGDTSVGQGYGIQDSATNSIALVLQNFAFANSTANYDINYASGTLPVVTGGLGDISALEGTTSFANVSIS